MQVYRQQNSWYEIYNEGIDTSFWIPAKEATLTRTFSDGGEPCMRAFSAESAPVYMFLRSNSYRVGPSLELRPLAFYHAGELVQVSAESSAGWLAAKINGAEDLVWFPASDATKTIPFPISAFTSKYPPNFHSAPRSDAIVLCSLGTNDYVILFEQFSSNGQLWYRTTPDGFTPAAWISADHVKIDPLKPVSRADIESGYLDFLRQRYPVATKPASISTSPEEQGATLVDLIRTCGIALLTLIAIIPLSLYALHKYWPFSRKLKTTDSPEETPMKLIGNNGENDPIDKVSTEPAPIQAFDPQPQMLTSIPHPLNEGPFSVFAWAKKYVNSILKLEIEKKQLENQLIDAGIEQVKGVARLKTARTLVEIENEKIRQELDSLQRGGKIEGAETNRRINSIKHQAKEDKEKSKTKVLEEQARQARLEVGKRDYERAGKEKPPQREVSIEERLRTALGRHLSREAARIKVLEEIYSKYIEKVRSGLMSEEEMEHLMASAKGVIDELLQKGI
jgi:hypothetical protein